MITEALEEMMNGMLADAKYVSANDHFKRYDPKLKAEDMPPLSVEDIARLFLNKTDEEWTFVDPDRVKALARAVLGE